MNILQLISSLEGEERDGFMEVLDPKTRSRRLLQVLVPGTDIPRDELFRRVFKVKRTPANDHLLRNELSILKRKLEHFITERNTSGEEIHPAYRKAYAMAEWCIQKALIEPAALYANKMYAQALEDEAFGDLLKLNRLRLHIAQFSKSNYRQKLEEMQSLRRDHLYFLSEFAGTELRYADFMNAGAYKLAVNLRMDTLPYEPMDHWNLETSHAKNSMARYYHVKSLAYSSQGLKAIGFLKKALETLDTLQDTSFRQVETITCYAAMAMEYSQTGNFSTSAELYEFIFSLPGSDTFTSRKPLLYNYCTTLLKIGEYKKALKYIEYLEASHPEPVVAERIYTLKCNCYIFLEDAKMIRKILPSDLQNYDVTLRVYYRFLYTIYYLIKGDHELAERELINIQAMKDFKLTGYMPLHHLFERYVQTLGTILYREKNQKKKISSLRTGLENFLEQNRELSGLLPAAWITGKIQAL